MLNKRNSLKTASEAVGIVLAVTCAALTISGTYFLKERFIDPVQESSASTTLMNCLPTALWIVYSAFASVGSPILGYTLGGLVHDKIQARGLFRVKDNNDLEKSLINDPLFPSKSDYDSINMSSFDI